MHISPVEELMNRREELCKGMLIGAILLLSVWFCARTTQSFLRDKNISGLTTDFCVFWASADSCVTGHSPYNSAYYNDRVLSVLPQVYKDDPLFRDEAFLPFAYPPNFLPLAAPFGLLDIYTAAWVWRIACVIMLIVGLRYTIPWLAPRASLNQQLLMVSLAIVVYPTVRVLSLGQTSLVAFCGMAIAGYAMAKSRPYLGGFGLLLALMKPNLVLFFVLYLLLRRQFKMLIAGAALTVVALGFGMILAHDSVASVLHALSTYANDPHNQLTWENMISFYGILPYAGNISPSVLRVMAAILVAITGAILAAAELRRRRSDDALAMPFVVMAALAFLNCHIYDAVIFMPFIIILISEMSARFRWWQAPCLAGFCALATPIFSGRFGEQLKSLMIDRNGARWVIAGLFVIAAVRYLVVTFAPRKQDEARTEPPFIFTEKGCRRIVVLLLLLAGLWVGGKGVRWFMNQDGGLTPDVCVFWTAAKCSITGESPYNSPHYKEQLSALVPKSWGAAETPPPFAYPPNFVPFVAPLGLLTPHEASWVLRIIGVLALIIGLYCAILWLAPNATLNQKMLMVAFAVILYPTVRILQLGQTSLLMLCGMAIAGYAMKKSRPYLGGIGLALGLMKPNLIVVFLVYLLLRRQFKMVAVGMALTAVALIGGLMMTHDSPASVVRAFATYSSDIHNQPQGMISLYGIFLQQWTSPSLLLIVRIIGVEVIVAIWAAAEWRWGLREDALSIPFVVIATLAFLNTHMHDAVFLIPLIVIAISEISAGLRWWHAPYVAGLLILITPLAVGGVADSLYARLGGHVISRDAARWVLAVFLVVAIIRYVSTLRRPRR